MKLTSSETAQSQNHGQRPITMYVRDAEAMHPNVSVAGLTCKGDIIDDNHHKLVKKLMYKDIQPRTNGH
uniref:Uncharacterized protein n=1 Tax=Heterorhabditis bacteriophora TaxID=37862 RepID=A0A1I7WPL7_HETBA